MEIILLLQEAKPCTSWPEAIIALGICLVIIAFFWMLTKIFG